MLGQLKKDKQAEVPPAEPGSEAKAAFVPGQLIVEYKDSVTECVHHLVASRKPFRQATSDASGSLDELHAKHGVRSAKAIFRSDAEEETVRGKSAVLSHAKLKEHHDGKLAAARAKFAKRSTRAPAGAAAPDLSRIYLLEVSPDADIEALVAAFAADSHVEFAQPNYAAEVEMVPDDPYFGKSGSWEQSYEDLWGLKKIQAEQAWDIAQGEGVVVGVDDTGVDYNHEDLANIGPTLPRSRATASTTTTTATETT